MRKDDFRGFVVGVIGATVSTYFARTLVAVDRGKRRRRSYSKTFKRRVVAETLEPDASVAEVARRHGLNANMVFMWRGDPRFGPGRDAPEFLPVEVRPAGTPVKSELVLADAKSQVDITLSSRHRLTLRGRFDVDVVLRLVRGMTTP